MKQNNLYEVEVMDAMRLGELERELLERNIEYKRIYDKFIIGDLDFIGMLHKDMVKIRPYKGDTGIELTKEEYIREVERDLEAIIFNFKQQLKDYEGLGDMPESRQSDYLHASRALKILDKLKSKF